MEKDKFTHSAERAPRKYVFLHPIRAKVGQIIIGLRSIVDQAPGSTLSFSEDEQDFYISDIKIWADIVVLMSSLDEDDACSVDYLLEEMESLDENSSVILQYLWQLRNLGAEDDGTFFCYEENEDYEDNEESYCCYCWSDICEIRSFSAKYLRSIIKEFADRYPKRKVVGLAEDGTPYDVTSIFPDDDGVTYICVGWEAEEAITTSSIIPSLNGPDGVVVKFRRDKQVVRKAIAANSEGQIFFEHIVNGEKVIAFHLGETLYDRYLDGDYYEEDSLMDYLREEDSFEMASELGNV